MPRHDVHPASQGSREQRPSYAKPFLVLAGETAPNAPAGDEPRRQPIRAVRAALQHWHLLSLDAPTIATLWTALIARSAGTVLPAYSLMSMFLVVWSLYVSDRLMDARPLRDARASDEALVLLELEPRHRFHHRYRRFFIVALACVTGVLGGLLPTLPIAALRLDLLLGAFLAGYFVIIHAIEGVRLPKEIAVGLFFAAAVFIPTVSRAPGLRSALAPAAVLLAGVCSFNCVAIYRWEHADLLRHGDARQQSGMNSPHRITLWAMNHFRAIGYCLLLTTAAAALRPGPGRPDCVAVGAATAALLVLDEGRRRFAAVTLRALADLALATPLLVWPVTSLLLRR